MPTPTNILFISHSAGRHGAEKSLTTLLKHIDRSRFNPIVILPENGPLEHQLNSINIEYYIIPMPRWVNWEKKRIFEKTRVTLEENKAVQSLITITQKYNIKLVYSNTIANRTGAKLAKKLDLPHIWHIREILYLNESLSSIYSIKKTLRIIENSSDYIIANSQETLRQFPTANTNKKTVIYNSIQNTNNNHTHRPIKKSFRLIYVGVLLKLKNIETLLNAISIIKKNNSLHTNLHLSIIGDGPEENRLKQLSETLSISDNITFFGYSNEPKKLLDESHIFTFPSFGDSWGRVVVEAMLTGLPVIGANAGGIPEIITDGKNGFLASPKDPQDWADKIEWIYNHYDHALNIAQFAQEHARKTYTIENYVGQIEKIIGDCLGK